MMACKSHFAEAIHSDATPNNTHALTVGHPGSSASRDSSRDCMEYYLMPVNNAPVSKYFPNFKIVAFLDRLHEPLLLQLLMVRRVLLYSRPVLTRNCRAVAIDCSRIIDGSYFEIGDYRTVRIAYMIL